jgi:hypothetical protein
MWADQLDRRLDMSLHENHVTGDAADAIAAALAGLTTYLETAHHQAQTSFGATDAACFFTDVEEHVTEMVELITGTGACPNILINWFAAVTAMQYVFSKMAAVSITLMDGPNER